MDDLISAQQRVAGFRKKWLEATAHRAEAEKRERLAYAERDAWKRRALEAEAGLAALGLTSLSSETQGGETP